MSRALPDGWKVVKLGDLGRWIGGGTPSKAVPSYWQGNIPWVSPKDMKSLVINDSQDHISELALAESSTNLVPADSVLTVTRSAILLHSLPVAVTERPVTINQDLKALTPKAHVDGRFVRDYLRSQANEILAATVKSGTTVCSVGFDALKNYEFPLPPFDEQLRIVARIEELTARSKTAKQAIQAIPPLLEKFRKSVLAAAFRGDLTAEWRRENQDLKACQLSVEQRYVVEKSRADYLKKDAFRSSSEGRDENSRSLLPNSWGQATVENLASSLPRSIQSGPFGSSLKHDEFQSEGVLAIGIDNVKNCRFSEGRQNRISFDKYAQLHKFEARPGDVLITVMATVGRCCVLPSNVGPAIITKHVYRITTDPNLIRPEFLMFALCGAQAVRDQLEANTQGATRAGINGSILKQTTVPLPPLAEQDEILIRIAVLLDSVPQEQLDLLSSLQGRLDQSILTKAFRGELIPQKPGTKPQAPS